MSASRGDVDLVGHRVVSIADQISDTLPPINNIIVKATNSEEQWVEDATRQIGPWRAKLRSTYIRWALAINALDVAAKKYDDPQWQKTKSFAVSSLRPNGSGSDASGRLRLDQSIIAQWKGDVAADAHRKTAPMLSAFGVIDLYANLEEVIFSLYRIYLDHHPDELIKGDEFKVIRRLRKEALVEPTKRPAWEAAWNGRVEKWQRNRIYDGLGKVFRAFCSTTGIKAPSAYKLSSVETWAETIELIALIRNSLVHGVSVVSEELDIACKKPYAMGFQFQKGQALEIKLTHLQSVDFFCEQILDALNLSLLELVKGPVTSAIPVSNPPAK